MRVPYAEAVYGPEEIEAVVEVLETSAHALMTGPRVVTFEDAVAALAGKTNGLMINSGLSSRATSCGNRGSQISAAARMRAGTPMVLGSWRPGCYSAITRAWVCPRWSTWRMRSPLSPNQCKTDSREGSYLCDYLLPGDQASSALRWYAARSGAAPRL